MSQSKIMNKKSKIETRKNERRASASVELGPAANQYDDELLVMATDPERWLSSIVASIVAYSPAFMKQL